MVYIEDSDNNLWVGTLAGGLNLLDRKTDTFKHYKLKFGDQQSLYSNYISALMEDSVKTCG
jgi:ligand-binding sensor domain-containing protein